MALKLIDATGAKSGTTIMIDGEAFTVRSNDISKSGKHGASKCRIEAIGVFTGKKKIIAVSGSERFEVPLIEKKKAQVLSVSGDNANVMDMESFESFDVAINEEVKGSVAAEQQVEYWDVEGKKAIMRVMT
jgi:translation initiation factor 5A